MHVKHKNALFVLFIICASFVPAYGQGWSDREREKINNASRLCSFVWGNPPVVTSNDSKQETTKRTEHIVWGLVIRAATHFSLKKIYAHFGWSNQGHDNAGIQKGNIQKSNMHQSEPNGESLQDVVDKVLINGKVFLQSDSGRYVLESTTNNVAIQLLFCNNNKYEVAKHTANFAAITFGAEIGAGYLCDALQVKRTSYTAMVIYGVMRFASCFAIRAVQTCIN